MEQEDDVFSILDKTYYEESRLPPPERGDGEGEEASWDWGEILLDHATYMIDERNHTTALCPVAKTASESRYVVKEDLLQVTFCLAPPPHISYFCMSYTSGEPTRFLYEPRILPTEGNLALIGLKHCTLPNEPSAYIHFVYRAPILAHDSPNLRQLTHPSDEVFPGIDQCYLPHGEVGILRYRSSRQTPNNNIDDYDAYKIATLSSRWRSGTRQYDLCTYDSKADAWTCKPTLLSEAHDSHEKHSFHRVITIGDKMGWVDLWRGILLCDVHIPAGQEESPGPTLLRYIPLPEPMQPDNDLPICGFASFFRDITVVQGSIKFVDLQIHASPGSLIPNGWTAVTWIMAPGDQEFRKDVELHSRDLVNGACLESSLFVAHPTLSSRDDDVLYLMTKASLDDGASQVIAVNMKTKKMERVAKFTTQREASMDFAYMRSTISNYLTPGNSRTNDMKRRGTVLHGSFSKKRHAINFMSSGSGFGGNQMGGVGDDGDNMELD